MIRYVLIAVLSALLLPALALSQAEGEGVPTPSQPAPAQEAAPAAGEDDLDFELGPTEDSGEVVDLDGGLDAEEDFELIEGLLEQGSEVLEAPSAYEPGDRRDPFRSLIQQTDDRQDVPRGPRPEGVPGLLIDEISVTGVWVTPDGPVAQIQSTDTPMSYLLREGDQLYDGEVVRISLNRQDGASVQFKQSVNDSTAPKPFRDVVRRLDSQ